MQALRLNEVLMRVVAWHNRHPLARRITASQVHSIGEVVLPFASAQPAPAEPSPQAAPAVPALHDLLDPPASQPIGLTALTDIDCGADATTPDADHPEALPAPETKPSSPPPEAPSATAQASLAEPAEKAAPADPTDPTEPSVDGPPDLPSEDLPEPGTEPEPEPVLSMEEEADNLFSSGDPPADDLPGQAPDIAFEAQDSDGPELLIEQTDDPDAPADTPPAQPADTAPEAAAEAPPDPADSAAPPLAKATEDDSAELAAAFAAATADDPLPASTAAADGLASDAQTADMAGTPLDPATAAAGPADPVPPMALPDADAGPADAAAPAHHATAATAPAALAPAPALAAPASVAGWLARLRAWLHALRPGRAGQGLPKLKATFSRDFIWPLRPAQVAGWVRRHGSLQTLAPPDWPQRLIDTDPRLQAQARSQGLPHDLPMHVLTAAIGVGDRRIRVLIDAQGHILGPRSYSPPKLAALASVMALGLVGAGWGGLPRGDSLSAKQASAAVAAAASAAAQAASAAALAAAAASAAESVWLAQRAEAGLPGTTPADAHDANGLPGSSPPASGPASEPAAGDALASAAPAAHDAPGAPPEQASEPAPEADTAPAAARTITRATLGQVLPPLSTTDKQAARQQSQDLRNGKAAAAAAAPPPPPTTVYALVTRLTTDKQSAARSLGLIRASSRRLGDDAPAHGELMQDQGAWRAAWWPFESQAIAERARVMLEARGVPSEVVEF